ncbi:hypothetical protein ZOSMA_13G01050 [Zostera marina]|uniref:Uncharacterized protein n=1 Tax=Zostera marina TaxID=29655 RepID=A0A0K9PY89_ZOSMR|nr:hypothetical protein ZOSMA_13G01050 [Zostera marina]
MPPISLPLLQEEQAELVGRVRVLALRGAHVIIATRNLKAAEEAKKLILDSNSNAHVDTMELDLSSFKSVRTFADNFIAKNLPLNLLINNAGACYVLAFPTLRRWS